MKIGFVLTRIILQYFLSLSDNNINQCKCKKKKVPTKQTKNCFKHPPSIKVLVSFTWSMSKNMVHQYIDASTFHVRSIGLLFFIIVNLLHALRF